MVEVKPITAEDTYAIRHSVLRPHQTIEDCKYDQDSVKGAFHLGGFLRRNIDQHRFFLPAEPAGFTGSARLPAARHGDA